MHGAIQQPFRYAPLSPASPRFAPPNSVSMKFMLSLEGVRQRRKPRDNKKRSTLFFLLVKKERKMAGHKLSKNLELFFAQNQMCLMFDQVNIGSQISFFGANFKFPKSTTLKQMRGNMFSVSEVPSILCGMRVHRYEDFFGNIRGG